MCKRVIIMLSFCCFILIIQFKNTEETCYYHWIAAANVAPHRLKEWKLKVQASSVWNVPPKEGSCTWVTSVEEEHVQCCRAKWHCGFSGFSDNMKKKVCELGSWVPVATTSMWLLCEKIAVTLPFFKWLITSIYLSGKHFPKTSPSIIPEPIPTCH